MKKLETIFPNVFIIEPDVFFDERGFFYESYSFKKFKELGIDTEFIQDNHSKSTKDTVRGLHFQAYPGQEKLVRCTKGKVLDVIADIRPDSPTFKKWFGVELSADNFKILYVPVGYAHGFKVLSDVAEIQYKVSNYYDGSLERTIYWNDKTIGVEWNVENPVLSNRDKNAPTLEEYLKDHPDPFK